LKQAFTKSRDKSHMRAGWYLWSTVICSTENEQSDCESTRSFQSVRSYKGIHGTFDSKGGRRPQYQRWWMATVQHLICVNVRLMGLDGRYRNGDRHYDAISCWRLKSSEYRSLRSCERSTTCIRTLAKLSLVTFSVAEPANWLYYCLSFSALTLLVEWPEGHPARKKLGISLLVVTNWQELCMAYSSSCHHHLHHP